ncbi:phosphatase PAP2 family protein [Streptococcus suis]|uniref:Phosphatase PAP2 family protein n=1 Tax=Streptococcus suis TaxID=1307 RepID=A0A4T2GJ24_STRSU|nr:phosphatase PAP2 family protein [Streptococcus suis]MBM7270322.1 phosphatase PAP2 family protein [Streptococcus suis]TIH98898.1 phosphatase PAP2 family protein [Streptococcus suis]
MKNKRTYLTNASFTALAFVILGYMAKFYPASLTAFDSAIQTAVRGTLPSAATSFWTSITVLGNTVVILAICLALAFFFYKKQWKAEAYFILASFAAMGVASTALKYVYQRPRPSIEWLIDTIGYSFPSWHTASTMMVAGAVVIIINQRMKSSVSKRLLQASLLILAVLVAVSRIYISVHYPTDIIGGWLLAATLLLAMFPYYDQKRFEWRFQSKQK